MKRGLMMALAVVVVAVGAVAIWWFTSTDIDDPVEVTAPPVTEATAVDGESPSDDGSQSEDDTAQGDTFELTDASSVTFEIDEELRGSPVTVVATNPEVAAQIVLDPADLANSQIGTVVIGAQTFETDSSNRNRAIRGPILDSSEFPTITFVPTTIEGLSGALATGGLLEFTVTGDLTIRDITQSVTFDVSASMPDESTIEGTAESTVSREAFELNIPSVPSVANVSDDVLIKIDFVAATVS